jgi:hypothetical protein
MLAVGRVAANRKKRTGTGVSDWPGQRATLGEHFVQTPGSRPQTTGAHQGSGRVVLLTAGARALARGRPVSLCFAST